VLVTVLNCSTDAEEKRAMLMPVTLACQVETTE
jgi:hypothetical protein